MRSYEIDTERSTQDRRVREADASDVEFRVLTTEDGARLLAEVSASQSPGPADVARWRKGREPAFVAAALRLAEARRKAACKFGRAGRMWLDPVGVEQATAEAVAVHKARRFEAAGLVVDLCSGIGGDALALAARSAVIAVDRDPGMGRRLAWNAGVYDRADRVLPCRASAESFAIAASAWIHVDPDRRTSNRGRSVGVDGYVPGPEFLRDLIRTAPGGAIKLGPASDFRQLVEGLICEVEIVSLDGEAKEATIWFGAGVSCRRRASKLPEGVTWHDDGADAFAPVAPVARWLYEPDPALSRSGLLDSFALANGLNRIAADLPYLTADAFSATPWLDAFEVRSVNPLDLKRLRRLIDAEGLGPVSVKHKTTALKPEALRPLLRHHGDAPTVLFLTGGSGPGRAIVTRRITAGALADKPS